MATLHVFVGIQGAGKSTFGRKLVKEKGYVMVSSDKVRDEMPDLPESGVFPEVYRRIAEGLKEGKDMILDATNITPKTRKRIFDQLEPYHVEYKAIAYYFPMDPLECQKRVIERNKDKNERYLPPEVPLSFAKNIIPPTTDEGFEKIVTVIDNEAQ